MNYQYCVILREGPNAGMKQYFWVDSATVDRFFSGFQFGENADSTAEMGHVVGQKKKDIANKLTDKVHFIKGKFGSLVF